MNQDECLMHAGLLDEHHIEYDELQELHDDDYLDVEHDYDNEHDLDC